MYFQLFNPNLCFCCWFPIARNIQPVWHWGQWQLIKCTRQHIKIYKGKKPDQSVTSYELLYLWRACKTRGVTSPRITINLTFCIHGRRWRAVGGINLGASAVMTPSISRKIQWPSFHKAECIWPHWDMDGDVECLGMCAVVLNVVIGLLLCLSCLKRQSCLSLRLPKCISKTTLFITCNWPSSKALISIFKHYHLFAFACFPNFIWLRIADWKTWARHQDPAGRLS